MPRRNPNLRPPHAEGAETPAPHREEYRERVATAQKEGAIARGREMLSRGEIWRPSWPGIFGRR